MPPEQLTGEVTEPTEAADVYGQTADGSFQQTYESYVEKYQLPVPSSNV